MTRDRGQWAELAVLATVLAIAALASYIHLREVWLHAGAPVASIGPLTVDGLFAAAWLRMRRRRHQGDPVGFLAWLALGLALVATVAGNLAAAWIAGHRDPLSLVVAAWPAVAFAVVWELVTGHGRQAAATLAAPVETVVIVPEPQPVEGPPDLRESDLETGGVGLESLEARVARLVDVEGLGRKRLAKELGIEEWRARQLLEEHRARQEGQEEATG